MHPTSYLSRRHFLNGIGAMGLSTLWPSETLQARRLTQKIQFDRDLYEQNNAQTIIVFLYGGPSELAGNMTNIEEISRRSTNPYPLEDDRYISLTPDHFWAQAGGNAMQRMLDKEEMNLFRTCFRTVDDTKSHGYCTSQAQRGTDLSGHAGVIATLASVLDREGVISSGGKEIGEGIPFVTLEGESDFFAEEDLDLSAYLKPVALGDDSSNPYQRRGWWEQHIYNSEKGTTIGKLFDRYSKRMNREGKIKEAFEKRKELETFVDDVNAVAIPEGVNYPSHNIFADLLKQAMKLLIFNPHTKVVSMGSPGLGGWDDHSDALGEYTRRMTDLMEAIEAAMAHMKAVGKTNINIVVFGEFGRNVNYNDSLGWDHGNNQNIYWFGGQDYFNRLGVVGETEVTGEETRLYLQPKNFGKKKASPHFQVFSVAATLYRLYGITNPELLTHNNREIPGIFKG